MSDVIVGLQITVLGMVSVFCILLILSLAMHFMSRLLGQLKEAPAQQAPAPQATDRRYHPSPTAPQVRDERDQKELMAVIAASIAAYKRVHRERAPDSGHGIPRS